MGQLISPCRRPCVFTHSLIRAVKLIQEVMANLNLKGSTFFIHPVMAN